MTLGDELPALLARVAALEEQLSRHESEISMLLGGSARPAEEVEARLSRVERTQKTLKRDFHELREVRRQNDFTDKVGNSFSGKQTSKRTSRPVWLF
jgi:hypothetical protein